MWAIYGHLCLKQKTWQVCLIAQEKYNASRTPLMKLRHPKETPKDIILELIATDVGANREWPLGDTSTISNNIDFLPLSLHNERFRIYII